MVVRVVVYMLCGEREVIDLCDTEQQFKRITVLQLKEKICQRDSSWSPEIVRLIFTDKLLVLEDSSLLTEYGIGHMSCIHMIVRRPGGGYSPGKGDGGMGDKEGKNRSMERLFLL